MVGIIQEQHPDRCRLFMQWKQMDWPILVDSLNLLEVTAVPITLTIDEHGIIRTRVVINSANPKALDRVAERTQAMSNNRTLIAKPPSSTCPG